MPTFNWGGGGGGGANPEVSMYVRVYTCIVWWEGGYYDYHGQRVDSQPKTWQG